MTAAGSGKKLTPKQTAVFCVVAFSFFAVMVASLGTPISKGTASRQQTLAFLGELLPEHDLTTLKGSYDPDAVLFHLIRTGEPEIAQRAIGFAAEHRFGYAMPYVIQRLGSDDPELNETALRYLREITGVDLGSGASAWRAWWRNPPRTILGLTIGETTFAIGLPTLLLTAGMTFLIIGQRWRLERASVFAVAFLAMTWFNLYNLAMTRLIGKHHECTIGSTRIGYFSGKGKVVGLEDARLAGEWFVFVVLATFIIGPFLFASVYAAVTGWTPVKPAPGKESEDALSQIAE
jgi:hypothetical protein